MSDEILHAPNTFTPLEARDIIRARTGPFSSQGQSRTGVKGGPSCVPGACRAGGSLATLEPLRWKWSGCNGAKRCSVAELVRWLVSHGRRRLLLLGDSIMEQFRDALVCAAHREGCTVTPAANIRRLPILDLQTKSTRPTITPKPEQPPWLEWQMTISCPLESKGARDLGVTVLFRRHGVVGGIKRKQTNNGDVKGLARVWNITEDEAQKWVDGYDESTDPDSPTQYAQMFDSVDAIVLNQGLHGVQHIESLFELVGRSIVKANPPLVLWTQTTPQHFPTASSPSHDGCPGDYWVRHYETTLLGNTTSAFPLERGIQLGSDALHPAGMDLFYCLPHRTPRTGGAGASPSSCHHVQEEHIMRQVLNLTMTSSRQLQLLPLFELLRSRWDAHAPWFSMFPNLNTNVPVRVELENSGPVLKWPKSREMNAHWMGEGSDCTHFCYSPTLFEPIIGLLLEGFTRAQKADES